MDGKLVVNCWINSKSKRKKLCAHKIVKKKQTVNIETSKNEKKMKEMKPVYSFSVSQVFLK